MRTKETIKSQYRASLAMLRQAIEKCPDPLWEDVDYSNPFWHVAYHVIFYTHFYLHPTEEDFVPWEKHRDKIVSLGDSVEGETSYSKEDVLEYLDLCLEQMEQQVDAIDVGLLLAALRQAGAPVLQHPPRPAAHGGAVRAAGRSRGDRGRLGRDEGVR
jgi:hypothetical protein